MNEKMLDQFLSLLNADEKKELLNKLGVAGTEPANPFISQSPHSIVTDDKTIPNTTTTGISTKDDSCSPPRKHSASGIGASKRLGGTDYYKSRPSSYQKVIDYYLRAFEHSGKTLTIDYEGRTKDTFKTFWYGIRRAALATTTLPAPLCEFQVKMKDMYGTIKHDSALGDRKNYKPPTILGPAKTNADWKGELLEFMDSDEEVFEIKDNLRLRDVDKDYIIKLAGDFLEIVILTDNWIKLRKV